MINIVHSVGVNGLPCKCKALHGSEHHQIKADFCCH